MDLLIYLYGRAGQIDQARGYLQTLCAAHGIAYTFAEAEDSKEGAIFTIQGYGGSSEEITDELTELLGKLILALRLTVRTDEQYRGV